MASFEKVMVQILINEGGLSKNKGDRGNYRGFKVGNGPFLGTKYGISAGLYCELHPDLSDAQVRSRIVNLTESEAKDIYKLEFWVKSNFASLNNDTIAYQFMDHLINAGGAGLGKVIRLLKSKYPFLILLQSIKDNKTKFFPDEIAKINAIENEAFYRDIQVARVKAYPASSDYDDNRKRPLRVRYEKKKTKPKSKSGIRNSSSVWDWLTGASKDKKFRL